MSSSSSFSSPGFVVNPSACFQPVSQLSILNVSPTVVLSEDGLRNKARKEAEQCADPVHRLRLQCLATGFVGPKLLIRKLLSLGKERINQGDLADAMAAVPGLKVDQGDAEKVFRQLGEANQAEEGEIPTAEVVHQLMPPINVLRRTLVERLFGAMDPQGEGSVPLSALGRQFDHRRHPKFESGAKSREELFGAFLDQFQPDHDGRVLAAEFLAFYAAQSAAVGSDIHFDWLVRSMWKI